jgi:NAD(P)-dependent dehydrogenase (short-subunit alcohol dehydrogenase family)
MSVELAGARVIVSGAAGGVGKATIDKLLACGARVCATDIDPAVTQHARQGSRGEVVTIVADVTKSADVDRIFACAEAAFGGVDCVVSNAASIVTKSVLDTTEDDWDRMLDTNAKSLFLMLKRALPPMMARRAGSIVATASISSVVGLPTQAAYAASKGAVLQLIRQTAVEYAGTGVRINAVGPGSITRTKILDSYLAGLDDPDAGAAAIKGAHPMGRWAEPEEVADAIVFLAGPTSTFITGQIIMVDGGFTAR